jgi:hypothetical protein
LPIEREFNSLKRILMVPLKGGIYSSCVAAINRFALRWVSILGMQES